MRFIVTGGAGFIGSHLVEALIHAGHDVIVIDDLSTGKPGNLPRGTRLVRASIADAALLAREAAGADGIYHLAARVSVQDCIDNWLAGHADNLIGTINTFAAAAGAGCPVVYASSAAVYGDRSGQLCSEEVRETPISPYGADKLADEHQARAFAAIRGLSSVGLRFFNVYGPRQDPASPYAGVISRFIANARDGVAHTVFGDGGQSRDFIEVSDIVAGLLAAMALAQRPVQAAGAAARRAGRAEVFNLCTGRETTLLDLIATLARVRGDACAPRIRHAPPRAGDIRHSLGSTRLMHERLGVVAQVPLDRGLARLLAHEALA